MQPLIEAAEHLFRPDQVPDHAAALRVLGSAAPTPRPRPPAPAPTIPPLARAASATLC